MARRDVVDPLAYKKASDRAAQPWLSSEIAGLIAGLAVWYFLSSMFDLTRLEVGLLSLMAFFVVWRIVSFFEDKFWAVYQEEFHKLHFGDGGGA
jgi:cellobiose-specific phosphotransferase system component IIC